MGRPSKHTSETWEIVDKLTEQGLSSREVAIRTGVSAEAIRQRRSRAETKVCSVCDLPQKRINFHKRSRSPDGLQPKCIDCQKKQSAAYYESRATEIIARVSRYYEANKPAVRDYRRARKKRLIATDPNFKLKERLRTRLYQALKGGAIKAGKTFDLVGCTVEELWIYLEAQFLPGMTRENYGEWHVDHIYPLAQVDLTNPRMQYQAFNYLNLRPLWGPDNISQGGRTRRKKKPLTPTLPSATLDPP